jgi:(p)ppGpp synthase/HD superfamily hydrolase
MITDRLSKALSLAIQAHEGDFRKGTSIPYISHPMGVASIILEFGGDEDQAIAGLLHDTIEDGGAKYIPLIEDLFGKRVLSLVEGCTDGIPNAIGEKTDWHERKRKYLLHLKEANDDVLLVSGADKLHNARAIVSDLKTIGQVVFERFRTKKEGTLWYYSSLAEIFQSRKSPLAKDINEAVKLMTNLE